MKTTTILTLALFLSISGLFAQKAPVIATVDIQKVLNDYDDFQAAVEKVKSTVAPIEEEMKRMQEEFQSVVIKGRELESEIENPAIEEERKAEAESEILELQGQLQELQLEIQQFRQQAQQIAQQGQQEELVPLQEKALEVVEQVAKEQGIDVVLPMNTVVFSSDELEISEAVIAALNAAE